MGRCDRTHNGPRRPILPPGCLGSLNRRSHHATLWWLALALIWLAGTTADRIWLGLDQRLPAMDQADYINSAVDHGRALGLLPGGGWQGWDALLDLSPKIPPLASLVNGVVLALSGQAPHQAAWALAAWQALLLVVVACWGRQLLSPGFGLLAAGLITLTPALAGLRVDFTLDLPLTASAILALWLLGRWQVPDPAGGRWPQAIVAAVAVAAALLVKQSALLVVLAPCLWAAAQGLGRSQRRLQVLAAVGIVLAAVLPWLRHNWITTLGGTNRAVLESAAAEGDPPPLSPASLWWYLRLWPSQLGRLNLIVGLAGAALAGLGRLPATANLQTPNPQGGWGTGWGWVLGSAASGWLFTTLSPNKDPRYITPVLPLLILLLTRGWWTLGLALLNRGWNRAAGALLAGALTAAAVEVGTAQAAELQRERLSPLPEAIASLRALVGEKPTTLVTLPNSAELNEHTATMFGRMKGGQIVGRRLGRARAEHSLVLDQAEWVLLTTSTMGMRRQESRDLAASIRRDPRFRLRGSWEWAGEAPVELWGRTRPPDPRGRFDATFIRLAVGMEEGPQGLRPVFKAIGPQHQLDGHFLYQRRVHSWAEQRLEADPKATDALWSLALLAVLRNRPAEADQWFARLEQLLPENPWPSTYRSVVLLAGWNPWRAHTVAEAAARIHGEPVLKALADVSGVLSGNPLRLRPALRSVPAATRKVSDELQSVDSTRATPMARPQKPE